ncbi:hypothetical protein [Leptolyngbya ohadii]|uniref:hypothetical protein n=1 Tax=Leptolyngbya ohadii TaxID=1962290 RepID=UPI000B59D2CF|nr:hypothetical protein [Leptolyngbya ohadii]
MKKAVFDRQTLEPAMSNFDVSFGLIRPSKVHLFLILYPLILFKEFMMLWCIFRESTGFRFKQIDHFSAHKKAPGSK